MRVNSLVAVIAVFTLLWTSTLIHDFVGDSVQAWLANFHPDNQVHSCKRGLCLSASNEDALSLGSQCPCPSHIHSPSCSSFDYLSVTSPPPVTMARTCPIEFTLVGKTLGACPVGHTRCINGPSPCMLKQVLRI